MQGVPEQFTDERDSARFRHLAQLPGLELYHAHIADYAFEPHTHEAFGIGTIETGAERFRYRGTQHLAAEKSVVTMNPDEIHTGESATEGGWRYRMVYIEPDLLEEVTGLRHWWFSDVTRHDPLRSQQIGQLIYGLWHTNDALAQKGLLLDLIETFQPLARHAPVARRARTASSAFATICTTTICARSPWTNWRTLCRSVRTISSASLRPIFTSPHTRC